MLKALENSRQRDPAAMSLGAAEESEATSRSLWTVSRRCPRSDPKRRPIDLYCMLLFLWLVGMLFASPTNSHLAVTGCLTGWSRKASSRFEYKAHRDRNGPPSVSNTFQLTISTFTGAPKASAANFPVCSSNSLGPERQSTYRPVRTQQYIVQKMMKTVLILLCVCLGPLWAVGSSVDQAHKVLPTGISSFLMLLLPVILCGADCWTPPHATDLRRSQTTCHSFNTRRYVPVCYCDQRQPGIGRHSL